MSGHKKVSRTLLGLLAALSLLAVSCGGSASSDTATTSDAPAATESEPAPAATEAAVAEASLVAATVSGSQIDFGSLEGQDVVLWFWAPW